jgi:5'-nucleotidase/UDP-sugar diphosphatase
MTSQAPTNPNTLTILFTNDLHGTVTGDGKTTVSIEAIAALKKKIPGALLFDAGDATQGGFLSTESCGRDIITLMNAAGYDAMAVGNHEFDFGYDHLVENARRADFPLLAANAFRHGRRLLAGETYARDQRVNNGCRLLLKQSGITVGIFAVGTPDLFPQNPQGTASGRPGIVFEDPIAAARQQLRLLRQKGADLIVCLAHLGNEAGLPESETSRGLARALAGEPGPDIILDGHSHVPMAGEKAGDSLIIQSGSFASAVGRLNITLSGEGPRIQCRLLTPAQVGRLAGTDPDTARLRRTLCSRCEGLSRSESFDLPCTLWGGTISGINEARIAPTNLGDCITDAMAAAARERFGRLRLPVIALHNGGGIRSTLYAGPITQADTQRVLPFGNRLYFREITACQLFAALENGFAKIPGQDPSTGRIGGTAGGYPHISGFSAVYDPNAPAGSRVRQVILDGETRPLIRNDRRFIIAVDEAKIMGGDGYTIFMHLKDLGQTAYLEPVFYDYLKNLIAGGASRDAFSSPRPRIRTLGRDPSSTYTACLTVTRGEAPVPGPHTLSIDGGIPQEIRADAQGRLRLADLADGPHTISLAGARDVLVNNYSGAGIPGDVPVAVTLAEDAGE